LDEKEYENLERFVVNTIMGIQEIKDWGDFCDFQCKYSPNWPDMYKKYEETGLYMIERGRSVRDWIERKRPMPLRIVGWLPELVAAASALAAASGLVVRG